MAVTKIIGSDGGTSGSGSAAVLPTIDNLSSQIDGTNTNFTTTETFQEASTQVYYNGILQIRNEDYTEDSDAAGITFQLAPEANTKVIIIYYEA